MSRRQRFLRLAPEFLAAGIRREWPLALLAIVCLAPGVAALVAWLQVAWRVRDEAFIAAQLSWILPEPLLGAVTPAGVLVGSGLVTLLVGCLGLSNAYLAGVERRLGDLALLLSLGLSRLEVMSLLLLEAMGLALLGTGAGLLLGLLLSVAGWLPVRDFLMLPPGFRLFAEPFLIGAMAGLLATFLFVGVIGFVTALNAPLAALRRQPQRHWIRDWGLARFSALGILFTAVLTALVSAPVAELRAAAVLTLLGLGLAALLNAGATLVTALYWHLPTPATMPLWGLAVQGLTRHRRQTTGTTLAMTAGALGVGLAALGWATRPSEAAFPLWAAAMLLITCASLVLTTAALAALERRQELGLLAALGARPGQVRRLILLENGIMAVGGGTLGALMALVAWWIARPEALSYSSMLPLGVAGVVVLAAVATALVGTLPVLWLISRQPPGVALRDRPWLVN